MSTNILEVRHLRKSYRDVEVIKDVSFTLKEGKIIGLLGRNGAGKTTLMKSILGLIHHQQGEILFNGERMNHDDTLLKRRIGSLVDVIFYEDLTAYNNMKIAMMLGSDIKRQDIKNRIDELLEFVDLVKVKNKKVKTFSFGMKQRLALAQSIITNPDLLILDEPFVGLDPIGIEEMITLLQRLCRDTGTCIILSSHQLESVKELADEIIVLSEGKIKISDTYESVVNSGKSLLQLMR